MAQTSSSYLLGPDSDDTSGTGLSGYTASLRARVLIPFFASSLLLFPTAYSGFSCDTERGRRACVQEADELLSNSSYSLVLINPSRSDATSQRWIPWSQLAGVFGLCTRQLHLRTYERPAGQQIWSTSDATIRPGTLRNTRSGPHYISCIRTVFSGVEPGSHSQASLSNSINRLQVWLDQQM